MRYFILLGLLFMFQPLFAQQGVLFEQDSTWEQILQKAKNEGKLVFVDVSAVDCPVCDQATATYTNSNVEKLYNTNFINYRIQPQNDKYSTLISRYKIKSYPSYLYIKPDGVLVYYAYSSLTANEFVDNAQLAIKSGADVKPIAQWDFEYDNQKTDKQFLSDYIEKRTSLGLDNADIIDQFTAVTPHSEILKTPVLSLLLKKNKQINANGAFFHFLLYNKDKVKSIMLYNDTQFNSLLLSSIDYSFSKACKTKNEALLDDVISAKLDVTSSSQDGLQMAQNEYRTKFYYATKQPVMFANFVLLYANTIMTQGMGQGGETTEVIETSKSSVNPKALFPATFSENIITNQVSAASVEELDIAYSFKLRDAAQYVVEMLSSKKMLNNALVWSQRAIELFDNFSNYETHAYVLYKLGKRNEAIASMERAYAVAPSSNDKGSDRKQVEAKLIKMKRGERIW